MGWSPQGIHPTATRRILLTGASSGIGFQAAVFLCRAGHRLTLLCRDPVTAETTLLHDLPDLESVDRCAVALLERREPIDSLVLNAGLQYAGASEPRHSAQGVELTFAGGRVGRPAGLGDLAGLRGGPGFAMVDGTSPFDAETAYKDSKLCNLLFAREWERRLRQRGLLLPVIVFSPGLVIPPGEGGFFRYRRTLNELGQRLFALVARTLLRVSESVEDAGALLAALAGDPAYGSPGFTYWCNRVVGPGRHRFEPCPPSPEACDDARASELWTLSAALLESALSPRAGSPVEPPPS